MRIQFILIATILSLLIPFSANATKAEPVINVVVDEWAPFGGKALVKGGISLDVITTVLSRAGYTVKSEIVPWERALNGVRSGTYDVIGNLFLDEELKEHLTFSQPFYETEVRFIQQKGKTHKYTDLNSLRPYSIAVGQGYLYEEDFDKADFLNKRVVTTVIQGVRMVANGRVDLTLDSTDVINYVINKEDPDIANKVEYLPNVLTTQAIHMGIRNDLPGRDQLAADFNRILSEMRADGSLENLLTKHQYD